MTFLIPSKGQSSNPTLPLRIKQIHFMATETNEKPSSERLLEQAIHPWVRSKIIQNILDNDDEQDGR